MDIVCASPIASQCERSVPYVDRSRAAAGASAFYGERLRDIVLGNGGDEGERSLLKKLRKTFMRGWIWVEFVQVRVLTNLVLSST